MLCSPSCLRNPRLRDEPLAAFIAATVTALRALSTAVFSVASDIPSLSSYENSIKLHPKYELYWTADVSSIKPKVDFAVRAATKGFVAFGISEVGGMVGTGKDHEGIVIARDII